MVGLFRAFIEFSVGFFVRWCYPHVITGLRQFEAA